jgi:hypothetical protein
MLLISEAILTVTHTEMEAQIAGQKLCAVKQKKAIKLFYECSG